MFLPLENGGTLYLKNLNYLYQRIVPNLVEIAWTCDSGEEDLKKLMCIGYFAFIATWKKSGPFVILEKKKEM